MNRRNLGLLGRAVVLGALLLFVVCVNCGEYGEDMLLSELRIDGPDEANRVIHPIGFSIIKPAGWIDRVYTFPEETPSNAIVICSSQGRYAHTYALSRIRTGSPAQALNASVLRDLDAAPLIDREPMEVPFQDDTAIVRKAIHRGNGFKNPSYLYGAVHFRRGETWYQIRFGLIGTFTDIPPGLWAFFETFQERTSLVGGRAR